MPRISFAVVGDAVNRRVHAIYLTHGRVQSVVVDQVARDQQSAIDIEEVGVETVPAETV